MSAPDLNRMWQMFLRIGPCRHGTFVTGRHIDLLRKRVIPLIVDLRAAKIIDWIHLMIHDDTTFNIGVIKRGDAVWHLRTSLHQLADSAALETRLPAAWEGTGPITYENYYNIGGLTTLLLESANVQDFWAMLGEETELLVRRVNLYREDADPAAVWKDLCQYGHLFSNAIDPKESSRLSPLDQARIAAAEAD